MMRILETLTVKRGTEDVLMTIPKKNRTNANRSYDPTAAEDFWTRRLESTDPMSAVLTYDADPELNRAYDRWEIENLLRLLPRKTEGKRALDLGCGVGRIAVALARADLQVTALDVSAAMLATCRRRASRQKVLSRVKLVHGSASDLAEDGPLFDIITCFGLLEHLPESQRRQCLERACHRLKRRGKMLVVVNNSENALLKPRYPLKEQRDDGYFVGLVGMKWLRQIAGRLNMTVTMRSANAFYALAHYLLAPQRKALGVTKRDLRDVCRLASQLDLEHPLNGPIPDRLASHFMVELRHKPRG